MSTDKEFRALTEQCLAAKLGEAKEPGATPEQIQTLLDKRLNVGRRNLGKLVCEAEGCSSTCIVAIEDGIPRERYISDLTNLLTDCVLWQLTLE